MFFSFLIKKEENDGVKASINSLNRYLLVMNRSVSIFLHFYPEAIPLIFIPLFVGVDFLVFDNLRAQTALFNFSISLFLNLLLYLSVNITVGLYRQLGSQRILLFLSSFPSLHTQGAFNFAVVGCFFYPSFSIIFLSLAFVYAYSRIFLKMHTLKEVVWGAILGSIVGAICSLLLPHEYSTPKNTTILGTTFFMTLVLLPLWRRRRIAEKTS